jgi:hypothetical protein
MSKQIRSPFSPINASGEIRLRKLLADRGIDPSTIRCTVWAGPVVHLFTHTGGLVPQYVADVKDFA